MMNEYAQFDTPLMLTLCLEEDSVLISKAVLDALEQPKQIQMLINDQERKLMLQACATDVRHAIVVPQYYLQFEMSGHTLLKKIRKLTGWTDDCPRVMYGELFPQHRAVVFDLNSAMPAVLQPPRSPEFN